MLIFKWVSRVLLFLLILEFLNANELIVYEAINVETNESCQFYEEKEYLDERSEFRGNCNNGFIEGNATLAHHNNHQYIGSFKEGYYHGYGNFSWTEESYIEGDFTKNYLTGFGKDYNEGIVSEGDFYKNIFTGYGQYTLDNNKSFVVRSAKKQLIEATTLENYTYQLDINVTQTIDYLKKSLLIREKYLKNHPLLAHNYSTLSQTLSKVKTRKSLLEALDYGKKALDLKVKIFDMNSSEVAIEYNNLSLILSDLGRAKEAVVYAEKGLLIDEAYFLDTNPNLALIYSNMALLYKDANQLIKGKEYILKALKLRKAINDTNSTDLAIELNTLGLIYQDLGDLEKAEINILKSLKLNEELLKKNHSYVIKSYSNLSMLYLDLHNLEKAKKYAEIFLALGEANFQDNKYDLAAVYSNVSLVYKRLNDLSKANKYARKSMKVSEKILPRNHSSLATIYAHLSLIYENEGKLKKAIKYGEKALAIRKNNYDSLGLMMSYRDLSFMYTKQRDYDKAFISSSKSFNFFLKSRNSLSQLNNRAKKKYLGKTNIHIYNLLDMSLLVKKDVSKEVFTAWIEYKGELSNIENLIMIFKNEIDRHNTELKGHNEEIELKVNRLRDVTREYSTAFLETRFSSDPSKENTLETMELEKENLEEYLSTKINEYNLSLNTNELSILKLSNSLGEDELYVDFAKTDRSYYIFTLNSKGEIYYEVLEDNASSLNSLIKDYRNSIIKFGEVDYNDELLILEKKRQLKVIDSRSRKLSNQLYRLLLDEPIKNLEGYKKLILSPDGLLNFLPFEALITNKNNYLVEEVDIEYISSVKELFKVNSSSKNSSKKINIIVFSDPDFNASVRYKTYSSKTKNIDDLIQGVEPLKYSQDGVFITDAFKKRKNEIKVTSFSEKNASKQNLFQVKSPTILHISTHSKYSEKNKIVINEPLLKLALVFAGHNQNDDNDSSAIVTALDFSTLNLYGTELVFFSSCESGLGDIISSEGAYGLSRAAKLAGAKRVISTIWEVSDEKSAMLTKSFYEHIEKGKGYVDALKQSKIEMIDKGYKPFYWAGFIENGIN